MNEWFLVLAEQLGNTPLSNWLVFFLAACHVVGARANSVQLYPAGMATVLVLCYNSFIAKDYATLAFTIYFMAMLIYGWSHWSAQGREKTFLVSYANQSDWWTALYIVGVAFPAFYMILAFAMDTDFPIWESGVVAAACGGVWLLNNRKIEYWVLLNVSQAFAIPLLVHSDRFLYALLSFFLYIFAFVGFFSWRRAIHQQSKFVRA